MSSQEKLPDFSQLIGNERMKRFLKGVAERGAIPHSLLFSGPEGVGKRMFALAFAKRVLKTDRVPHPDLHLYRPEGKIGMHSIETLRALSREVYLPPFEAKKKVFLIEEAERMLPASANALLKTFEEPSKESVIILLSSRSDRLLPTILSRCQKLTFLPIEREELRRYLVTRGGMSDSEAAQAAIRAKGSIGKALQSPSCLDPSHAALLRTLMGGAFPRSYSQILLITEELSLLLEGQLKQEEEELRSSLLDPQSEHLTAFQKEGISKEMEGSLTMRKLCIAKELLETLQAWYRDLHLLRVNGDRNLLMLPEYEETLVQALQRGEIRPLDRVEEAIAETILSLERATSLKNSFETLFLRLF